MTPLKLLYVVGTFPKTSETFVANEVLGLLARGHQVTLATLKRGERPRPEHRLLRYLEVPLAALAWRVPVRRWGTYDEPGETLARKVYARAAGAWLARQVRRDPPSIVHAHFINRPTLVARATAGLLGVPVTFMTHASDYRVGTSREALRARLTTSGAAFVISESARQQLADIVGDPGIVSAPTISVVRASMGSLDAGEPRSDRRDRIEVVTVARLVPKKGIDAGLRAFAMLRGSVPQARYRIAGDGPELATLKALAEELRIADQVEFLGLVDPQTARNLTRDADIALLPCRVDRGGDVDGIPVSLMEAGAAGVAVVSTRLSGLPELIDSGYSGILTEPDDVPALGDALCRLAADAQLRRLFGTRLRQRVMTEFAQDRQLDRLEDRWRTLITQPRTPPPPRARLQMHQNRHEA